MKKLWNNHAEWLLGLAAVVLLGVLAGSALWVTSSIISAVDVGFEPPPVTTEVFTVDTDTAKSILAERNLTR